jgi:hypothetical protein
MKIKVPTLRRALKCFRASKCFRILRVGPLSNRPHGPTIRRVHCATPHTTCRCTYTRMPEFEFLWLIVGIQDGGHLINKGIAERVRRQGVCGVAQ